MGELCLELFHVEGAVEDWLCVYAPAIELHHVYRNCARPQRAAEIVAKNALHAGVVCGVGWSKPTRLGDVPLAHLGPASLQPGTSVPLLRVRGKGNCSEIVTSFALPAAGGRVELRQLRQGRRLPLRHGLARARPARPGGAARVGGFQPGAARPAHGS